MFRPQPGPSPLDLRKSSGPWLGWTRLENAYLVGLAVGNAGRRRRVPERRLTSEMDRFFASAYKADPGVPYSGPRPFANLWIGTVVFAVMTWIHPYFWQLSTQFNWHDKAFLFEQYHWKEEKAKNQPYKFKWNQKHEEIRDSYYNNWADYFP